MRHTRGGEGQAKTIRTEMLRWRPDKFSGKVLYKVAKGDRKAVREAVGHVARTLTGSSTGMRRLLL